MARASLSRHRSFRRAAGFAALSLATLACAGAGGAAAPSQERSSDAVLASGRAAEERPLDEATVRRVVAVMRAWTPAPLPPPKGREGENVIGVLDYGIRNGFTAVVQRELADHDSTATIDGTPPLKAAIVAQGMSSREFVEALLAFQAARINGDLAESLRFELTGVLKRNVEVVRRVGSKKELPSWW